LIKGTGKPMDYNRYGTTTRKKIKNSKALQVTPWAKEVILPAHNEMTHHTEFPKNMAFLCKEPAQYGGETAIYDCARAFENLSPEMQQKISNRNVICRKRYVESASDLRYISWKQVLGEDTTREQAMEHFSSLGYQCHSIQEKENGKTLDILEIHLLRPMVYQYRGKTCLHASMIPLTPFWYWQIWPGKTPPLMVTWENGEPLSYEEFYELDEAVLAARIRYDGWKKHDVLVVDNPRIAHGRLPYTGERLMGGLMAQPARFIQNEAQWQVEIVTE
ncbi:MAG: TauD/TfdA family dioxygenase, partial [Sinomicrobium sp.]|nr:TauD/TfdA family dioxygenase [Sinomicrobium sp.]